MASDKLRRKVRRKLGISNLQPAQQQQQQPSTPSALQVRPVRAKGCCGKNK
ncbi:hypothetical protein AB4X15_12935 [Peribacillus simplex]|uniref:hypothetical protein n=1 Tax=Peribacillus TaxID=2675229 RepID=UPI00315DAA96